MPWPHERGDYRIAYPTALRPRLEVHDHPFDVLDLSQHGIRFRLGEGAAPPVAGNELRGVIRFRRGEAVTVRGVVLRVDAGEVAAHLDEGIPLRIIREEQRVLLDRHRNPAK